MRSRTTISSFGLIVETLTIVLLAGVCGCSPALSQPLPASLPSGASKEVGSGAISGEVRYEGKAFSEFHCVPPGESPYPAVLILHGAEFGAALDDYRQMCADLAAHGYYTIYVEYFSLTGGISAGEFDSLVRQSPGAQGTRLPSNAYNEATCAAIWALRSDPRVDGSRIAIIGFSLGGVFALVRAANDPGLAAIVVYYTPISYVLKDKLEYSSNAPILIIQGENDDRVPLQNARDFDAFLGKTNHAHELVTYPDAGYEFNLRSAGNYDAVAAGDAWRKTLAFLARCLMGSGQLAPPATTER